MELLSQTRRPRILVVGDVMLDRYLWGDGDRISPEAPIPVLNVAKREERLGGAGSVVTILSALDADVILASAVADDPEGRRVRQLLDEQAVASDCLVVATDRSTTIKERLLGRTQSRHPQQIIRVDRENTEPIGDELTDQLLRLAGGRLNQLDMILVSDYNKGICGDRLIAELVRLARQAGVPVIADPVRDADYRRYAGCACITPNRTEAGLALGMRIDTPEDGLVAARTLLRFEVDSVVVTLDRDGIAWADSGGESRLFPARPRQVYDITGAGDMVLAALGYGLASGADWPMVIELANLAGGLEVERLGVTPLTRSELRAELSGDSSTADQKIVPLKTLLTQLRQRRQAGQRIAMTNGCFDLLHPGHVASLQHARNQGDCLVVGLNSDQSVECLKGPGHPIIDQQGRAETLAALGCVDYVVIFDDQSVAPLVEQVKPDVLVKAAQYGPDQVVGHEIVEQYGGRVVLAPMKGTYSTSGLIDRIRNEPRKGATGEG
jgi:D-beta-D-heptose 7-phosphate kinase/D-beta-D-heptose 1-phosphate adenosyltransferase